LDVKIDVTAATTTRQQQQKTAEFYYFLLLNRQTQTTMSGNMDDTSATAGANTNTSSIKRWLSLKEWDNVKASGELPDADADNGVRLMIRDDRYEGNDFTKDVAKYQEATAQDVAKLRSWTKHEIVSTILAEAQRQNIKCENGTEVTEVGQLYQLFQEDGSLPTAEKLWHCFFGVFDRMEAWEVKLEKKFMNDRKWGYRSIHCFVVLSYFVAIHCCLRMFFVYFSFVHFLCYIYQGA
jgi:hypothetical protein